LGEKNQEGHAMTSIVLWVENLAAAKTFYQELLSAPVLDDSATFVRVASPANEVLLHLVPEQYREGIATPPDIRELASMKPIFSVTSIAEARMAVADLAGEVYSADTEQVYAGSRYCDGFDTEGNVFQVAERE
jgi:catechol 2,3-dioxygenase-like lactoylglutathione lyase family enzyme